MQISHNLTKLWGGNYLEKNLNNEIIGENSTILHWAQFSRTFRSRRAMIERCFGILKNSYSAVGTRRYRCRKWSGPLICNITAALYNRRKLMFLNFRRQTGVLFMPWIQNNMLRHVEQLLKLLCNERYVWQLQYQCDFKPLNNYIHFQTFVNLFHEFLLETPFDQNR